MSFSDHKIVGFTHKISDLPDQPNMQPEELKAHFDSSPEELRQALNALCDALAAQTAAADIGFAQTAGVPETTVQEAIENVQSQVTEAIIGSIPSGSITGDKLAQDVRDRFSAIESAATAEASTRASADSNLQGQINTHTTQIAAKCEIVAGYYNGNQAASQIISLGRTPKAVLVMAQAWGLAYRLSADCYGGLAMDNSPAIYRNLYTVVSIVQNGFEVYYNIDQEICTNGNYRYHYIAFF